MLMAVILEKRCGSGRMRATKRLLLLILDTVMWFKKQELIRNQEGTRSLRVLVMHSLCS